MSDTTHTATWLGLAIRLYDRLTRRNAEIAYEFSNMNLKIPSGTGQEAEHAEWVLDGTIKIHARDNANCPN